MIASHPHYLAVSLSHTTMKCTSTIRFAVTVESLLEVCFVLSLKRVNDICRRRTPHDSKLLLSLPDCSAPSPTYVSDDLHCSAARASFIIATASMTSA